VDTQAPPFFVLFPRPDLIGRDEDIERLHAILQQRQSAAVTPALTGQGGIGKTQLAIRYAYEKGGAYPGGVFWVNAAREAKLPITAQLGHYGLSVGLAKPQDTNDEEAFYRQLALAFTGQVLSRPGALLNADNVDDRDLLLRDLPGLPATRLTAFGCKVLITSRLANLPNCTDIGVDILSPEDARQLLMRESGRSAAGIENRAALDDVARMVGRLPLGLRLVGAILRDSNWPTPALVQHLNAAPDIVEAIDENIDELPSDYQDRVERSPKGVLKWSWDSLERIVNQAVREASRELFQILGRLPETEIVRLELLRQLVGRGLGGQSAVRDAFTLAVRALFDRNLAEEPHPGHVRLHPLVHKYARGLSTSAFAESLIIRAAERLRSPEFLAVQNGEALLTLLRELPMLIELTDERF
jgi:NB-ARC domain